MKLSSLALFAVLTFGAGCLLSQDSSVVQGSQPFDSPPVDTARVKSADEVARWRHRRELSADLNGDGNEERLILASDVEVSKEGEPIWEDGHRWALLAEEDGVRTLLYAAFVPNGHAEAGLKPADPEGRRHVLVVERTPHHTRTLVVSYEGPGKAKSVSAAHHQVDRWIPALAEP